MWAVVVGVLLVLMKIAEFGPVADWAWWWVLLPFGVAAVWWAIADATGLTQKRAIDKLEARKIARRERDMKALGLNVHSARRIRVLRESGSRPAKPSPESAAPPAKDPTN